MCSIYSFLFFLTLTLFSCAPEKDYLNKNVIENYQKKQQKISELKSYYSSIVPKDKFVEIEFEGDDHLFRLGVYSIDSVTKKLVLPGFLEWDLKTNSDKVLNAVAAIGWNKQTFKTIKQKLDKANCISVESGEPCKIGFQRRNMGKYYYLVFDKPMSDSLKTFYKTYCAYKPFNDKVVFEWGAGAIGGDCYPAD
jgi:hypothetical protein